MTSILELIQTTVKEGNCSCYSLSPSQIVFEERVKLNCFNCPMYGVKSTCPPNIPDLDYLVAVREYTSALLVVFQTFFQDEITIEDRKKSSNHLHSILMKIEGLLWENNYPLGVSFQGGSCKLCSGECSLPCRQPLVSRIPMEGIGINVVETAKVCGVSIIFPPKEFFYRVGLVLW